MSKKYKVPVSYTFTGYYTLIADSKEQAKEYTEKHCGMTTSSRIHSVLDDDTVDWEFPVHPDSRIGKITIA